MKKIFSIALIIILFILVFIIILISTTKNMVKIDNLADYIKDANILNAKVSYIMNYKEDITIKEKIKQIAINNDIPLKIIDDLLKSEEINELLGEYFSNLIGSKEKKEISSEILEKIKKVSKESLDRHINIMLDEEDLSIRIDKWIEEVNIFVFEGEAILENMEIKYILNINVIYFYIASILVLVLLSILNGYKTIKYLALILLILGVMFVTFGCLDNLIINNLNIINKFIPPLITNLLTLFFKNGFLVTFIGVILIIIYNFLNSSNNRVF